MTLGSDLEVLHMGAIVTASLRLINSTLIHRTDTKTTKSRVSKRKKLVHALNAKFSL